MNCHVVAATMQQANWVKVTAFLFIDFLCVFPVSTFVKSASDPKTIDGFKVASKFDLSVIYFVTPIADFESFWREILTNVAFWGLSLEYKFFVFVKQMDYQTSNLLLLRLQMLFGLTQAKKSF